MYIYLQQNFYAFLMPNLCVLFRLEHDRTYRHIQKLRAPIHRVRSPRLLRPYRYQECETELDSSIKIQSCGTMSHLLPGEKDDSLPSVPPPSYEEALNSAPVLPARPQEGTPQQESFSHVPPAPPPRPQHPTLTPQPFPCSRPPSHQNPAQAPTAQTSQLYSNNSSLPFDFPRGYLCSKCKNTGFREKNGKPCSHCWPKFFKKQTYNPNPALSFRYPPGFICDKCCNTGLKLKNGLSCQDCYSRFAPRNLTSQAPITYARPPFSMQFTPYNGFSSSGFAPGGFAPPVTPQYLQPGDPRMGGTICGRCRGSGRVTFFLDQELCLICGGVGRLFNYR